MYKVEDFKPGDVVFATSSYYKHLICAIVLKVTPKRIQTTVGIKRPSALCFAPPSIHNSASFQYELNKYKRSNPNIDINFKVIDKI